MIEAMFILPLVMIILPAACVVCVVVLVRWADRFNPPRRGKL